MKGKKTRGKGRVIASVILLVLSIICLICCIVMSFAVSSVTDASASEDPIVALLSVYSLAMIALFVGVFGSLLIFSMSFVGFVLALSAIKPLYETPYESAAVGSCIANGILAFVAPCVVFVSFLL
ncbi:MAG: hypothetical protein J6A83_05210 [Clostridia bacterium]|nr:hypothetical protein [Clostridia bacterium]